MTHMRRFVAVSTCLLLAIAAGHFVTPTQARAASAPTLQAISNEIASIVDKSSPAVVQIIATVKADENPQREELLERMMPFLDPRLREQLPDSDEKAPPRRGVGSGCIIDKDGVILTNTHVVKDADKIEVILSGDDSQTKHEAKVLGVDPDSDVAVIKIDAKNLPVLDVGDSDKLKVGNLVLAIGSPQGLRESVSFGIVSAKDRSEVRMTEFANFIQTDAAINRGNSGGPLLDMDGRLIGINTWIFSTSGGSQGLGFAIPINQAVRVAKQLREKGYVARGWLGVMLQELTPEFREHLGTGDRKGAVVSQTFEEAPAYGKLQPNDAIVALNGQELDSMIDFRNRVAAMGPGETAKMTVYRNGKERTVKVELGERPSAEEIAKGQHAGRDHEEEEKAKEDKPKEMEELGFSVKPIPDELAERLELPDKTGLLVTDVNVDSAAYEQGLRRGNVIIEVNRQKVKDADDFESAVAKEKDLKSVMLMIRDRSGTRLMILPRK